VSATWSSRTAPHFQQVVGQRRANSCQAYASRAADLPRLKARANVSNFVKGRGSLIIPPSFSTVSIIPQIGRRVKRFANIINVKFPDNRLTLAAILDKGGMLGIDRHPGLWYNIRVKFGAFSGSPHSGHWSTI
jgi:hypothetical protein